MLLIADKPSGITSYDCIRALKRVFPGEKIGHAGTLDPMASGLMLIGVGKGTKLLHNLQGLDKSYVAEIDFSKISDTRDLDYRDYYEELDINKTLIPDKDQINKKLSILVPEYNLPLPPFSAKKKDGKKMYELAREGKQEIEYRIMKTNSYKVLEYHFPILKLELDVGSGTYIRSIGYWLGKELELGGILISLRRTKIGKYNLNDFSLEKDVIFTKNGNEYIIRFCCHSGIDFSLGT